LKLRPLVMKYEFIANE